MKRPVRLVGLGLLALATMAHVGSPNVVFDGNAGPYTIRVIVRPPQVVPGLADITVRTAEPDVRRIVIRPVFWRTGAVGAPAGDAIKAIPGETGAYAGTLWLMSRGAYSVYVTVDGGRGSGVAIVPVLSVATGRLGFPRFLGIVLGLFGVLLLSGLVTIVHGAAGEALEPPGARPGAAIRRRARWVGVVSAPVITLLVFGGAAWWQSVDRDYQRSMYRPLAAITTMERTDARTVLTLRVRDTTGGTAQIPTDPVLPDHGKLVHLFLIRDSSLAAFAHLHPVQSDRLTFTTSLPPLPPGRYRLFADLVFDSGAEQTVATMLDVPVAPTATPASDPDDGWWVGQRDRGLMTARTDTLADGGTITWSGPSTPIVSGRDVDLRFVVRDRAGQDAPVEPYMGMAAHAVIMRDDGSVFVHLHPMGTASMAAQQAFALRDRGDTTSGGRLRADAVAATNSEMVAGTMPGSFSLPYAFPKPGRYRVWVQIRRSVVETAAFDVEVQ